MLRFGSKRKMSRSELKRAQAELNQEFISDIERSTGKKVSIPADSIGRIKIRRSK